MSRCYSRPLLELLVIGHHPLPFLVFRESLPKTVRLKFTQHNFKISMLQGPCRRRTMLSVQQTPKRHSPSATGPPLSLTAGRRLQFAGRIQRRNSRGRLSELETTCKYLARGGVRSLSNFCVSIIFNCSAYVTFASQMLLDMTWQSLSKLRSTQGSYGLTAFCLFPSIVCPELSSTVPTHTATEHMSG
jgi:hypothetical protein